MNTKRKQIRKRKLVCFFGVLSFVFLLPACAVKKLNTEKLREIEFTVVDTEDLPEKLQAEIEPQKKEPMMMVYSDGGWTYLVRGYGTQDKTGYSVSVTGCYEEEQSLCVETELLGPKRDEEIKNKKTYPYVVIKIEYVDKPVVFQ